MAASGVGLLREGVPFKVVEAEVENVLPVRGELGSSQGIC